MSAKDNFAERQRHWEKIEKEEPRRVHCDDLECYAVEDPQTLEEYITAHDHWKNHGYFSGCSHGN
jgi:hypothetical protein